MNKEKVYKDLLGSINGNGRFLTWVIFLFMALAICLYAYYVQLKDGLGVTGMGDYVSWGIYISNFVFFVATSLVGMLISSVLGLSKAKWIMPISRIAEIVAVAFAMVAGLVIVSDMGRPDRLQYVLMHGRLQSPIAWDITVVTTYVAISLMLLYLPLIPDLAVCRDRLDNVPKLHRKLYNILSMNWTGSETQFDILKKGIRILLVLIIPVALAIHTVTSWLFAVTHRHGWDSTIFGPYFVTGAFVSGAAAVIIAMYFFRSNYRLKDYITLEHFDKMGKILVLVSLVYLYFNINEYLVPGYKMKAGDDEHIRQLFSGSFAPMFWLVQLGGLVLPIILLLFKKMRRPGPIMIIAIVMFLGAWFKRYIIVIPTQLHPHLPIQNVPERFTFYTPTGVEIAVTLASFILALIIITFLSKLFPVIPMWEYIEEKEKEEAHNIENKQNEIA